MSDTDRFTTSDTRSSETPRDVSRFWEDSRGVSITIDVVLGIMILLTISTLFLTGLSDAADVREETTTGQELERISEETANALVSADSLATTAESYETRADTSGTTEVTVRHTLPESVFGGSYTIGITSSNTNDAVTVTAQKGGLRRTTNVTLTHSVPNGYAGGDQPIQITVEGGEITIEGVR